PPADRRSLPGRDQSSAGRADGRRRVPRRSVLSPQRLPDPGPSAARPPRGHPGARQPLPEPLELTSRRTGRAARGRRERPDVASLAGQRSRAAQRHRTRGDRRPRPGNPPRAPTPTGRSATQAGFPRHGSRGNPEPDHPLDRERTSPARPGGDGRLYPLRPLPRLGRAALASVTPPPEPGQPRQRRLADRHPSRDAAAEAAEAWDRMTLALAITCDPRGGRISRTVSTTAWALAAGMARVAQAARSAVPPDDEAGRHGPGPELPACSSDIWPRSAVLG